MQDFKTELGIARQLRDAVPRLKDDPLASAIVAMAITGNACDSRSAATRLELEHAIVLRAVNMLCTAPAILKITRRNSKTARLYYKVMPEHLACLNESLKARFKSS